MLEFDLPVIERDPAALTRDNVDLVGGDDDDDDTDDNDDNDVDDGHKRRCH